MRAHLIPTRSLPILTFHSIEDASDAISFSPQTFERGIAHLRALGFGTLTLSDLATRAKFPECTLVITFDDGYHSVYTHAFPLLRQNQMTATVFIAPGEVRAGRLPALNTRAMLSWDEMREMQKAGFEFGAHTLTHPDLARLPLDAAEREMRLSKEIIEQTMGCAVNCFAYPFGRHNARVRNIAQKHFACAVTDELGLAHSACDRYALPRVEMYYFRRANLFSLFSTRWLAPYLGLRNMPRHARRAFLSR